MSENLPITPIDPNLHSGENKPVQKKSITGIILAVVAVQLILAIIAI